MSVPSWVGSGIASNAMALSALALASFLAVLQLQDERPAWEIAEYREREETRALAEVARKVLVQASGYARQGQREITRIQRIVVESAPKRSVEWFYKRAPSGFVDAYLQIGNSREQFAPVALEPRSGHDVFLHLFDEEVGASPPKKAEPRYRRKLSQLMQIRGEHFSGSAWLGFSRPFNDDAPQ